jgi:hypothetical protein
MGTARVGRHVGRGWVPGEATTNFGGSAGVLRPTRDTARPLALGAGVNYGKHNI